MHTDAELLTVVQSKANMKSGSIKSRGKPYHLISQDLRVRVQGKV